MADSNSANTQSRKPWSTKGKVLAAIAALLSIVALIVGVRLTVAAFSANDYLKAVAATNEAPNLLSSDLLASYSSEPKEKDVITQPKTVSGTGDPVSFKFSIFNYLERDPSIWCQKNIEYNIKVTVEGSQDSSQCSFNGKSLENEVTLSEQKLKGRQKSDNVYTLTLPRGDVNTAKFKVRVDVTDSGGTTIRYMAADIAPSQEATVTPSDFYVSSADESGANTPADFDAYNYDVTVIGGERARVALSWDPEYVQLDPYFSAKHPDDGVQIDVDNHKVSFFMDPGTVRVNFYRLNGKVANSWNGLVSKAEA